MKKVLIILGSIALVGVLSAGLYWIVTKDDVHFYDNHAGAVWKPLEDDAADEVNTEHNGVAMIGGNKDNSGSSDDNGGSPDNSGEASNNSDNYVNNGGQDNNSGNQGGSYAEAYNPNNIYPTTSVNQNNGGGSYNNRATTKFDPGTLPEFHQQETTKSSNGFTEFVADNTSGEYNGFSYTTTYTNTYYVTITDYKGSSKNVSIPSKINGNPVMYIAQEAFKDKGLTSITIPETVIRVGDMAFAGNCSDGSLSVSLPSSLTSIGEGAFAGINVTKVSGSYSLHCGSIYQGSTLVCASGLSSENNGTSNREYNIKPGTTNIAYGAFYKCRKLYKIYIPDSMRSIGKYAFADCTSLQEIKLPASVTFIETGLFQNCASLKSVYFMYATAQVIDSKEYIYSTSAFTGTPADLVSAEGIIIN